MRQINLTQRRSLALAGAVGCVALSGAVANAVDRTWNGANSNNFSLNTNWTANITPISTDNAVFRNQAGIVRSLVVMDANRTVAAMSVNGTPSVGAYEFQ